MIETEVSLLFRYHIDLKEVFINFAPKNLYLLFQFLAYILNVIFFRCIIS